MNRAVRIVALLLLVAAVAGSAWLWTMLSRPHKGYTEPGITVEIPVGAPVRGIAALLEEKGVVRSRRAFELLCRWRSNQPPKPGEYRFEGRQSAFEVFRTLAEGRVVMHELVIPEGWTMWEIAERVEALGLAGREEFLAVARDTAPIAELAPGVRTLEGFLFPATYHFPRGVSAEEIIRLMVQRFRDTWEPLAAAGPNPQNLSVREVVTLASLVERETGQADERGIIAAVFYNRLRRGMALQCDPTVVYALRLAGRWRGVLTLRDLRFDSPYNTYRHTGLPPGPIANPGAAALRATLDPPEVEHLYFVSNGYGGHFFARTLREHNQNVARYRQIVAEYRRQQAAQSEGNGATRESTPQPPKSQP